MKQKSTLESPIRCLFAIVVAWSTLGGSPVVAHDMWLVPPDRTVKLGTSAEVVIAVGMDFPNSLNAITPSRLKVAARDFSHEVGGLQVEQNEKLKQTTISFSPDKAGSWLVSCQTEPRQLEMKAAAFNEYLLHDGLPLTLGQRMESGELDRDAREQYSKYTKALLQVGEGESKPVERVVLGHKLEIVLLDNPFEKEPGETLMARVLFQGQPLAGANLCWDHPGNGEAFSGQTWTDSEGKAMVPISRTGLMTLRLVHMTRPDSKDFEWESFWSSFTLRIPGDAMDDGEPEQSAP